MRKFLVALTVVSLAGVGHAQHLVQPDFIEMAKASAELNGIPVTEAIRRIDLQGRIIDLQNRYLERFPNEFAGIVIEPTATSYGFRVLLKGARKNALLELADAPDLAAIGREEVVARSFVELRDEQLRILDGLYANGVRAGSSIDLAQNRINIVTRDRARIDALVAEGRIAIPDFAVIVEGDPTAIDQATIRGGVTVEGSSGGCQTGFSVRNYSGVRGTVTAAHCDNAMTTFSGGANIGALQQATTVPTQYNQGLDIQWHATTANTYPNQIQYGSTIVSITSTAGVSVMQPNLTEVCVVRYRTQTTSCGRIYNTSFYVDHQTYGRSGPFVGVNPVGALLLTESGDSGGPWFFGNKAYGIHSGLTQGSVSFFTPADKLNNLSVVVHTTTP